MSLKRTIGGFVLAPLPVVAPVILLFGIILLGRPYDSASVIGAGLELVMACYGVTLLIGIPVHLLLTRLNRRSLRAYLGLTTLCAVVVVSALGLLELLLPPSLEQNPHGVVIASRAGMAAILAFGGLALLGAWIFWFVSVRQRHPK